MPMSQQRYNNNIHNDIGASLSEPHTGQTASPAIYDLSYVIP